MQVASLVAFAFIMLGVTFFIRWKNAGGRVETTNGIRPSDGLGLWLKEKALDVLYCFTGTRTSRMRLVISAAVFLGLGVVWGGYMVVKEVGEANTYQRVLDANLRVDATVREVYIHERRSRRSYQSWHTAAITYALPNESPVELEIKVDAVEANSVGDTMAVLVDPENHASAYSVQYLAAHSGYSEAVTSFVLALIMGVVFFLALGLPWAYVRARRPAPAAPNEVVTISAGPAV